MFELATVPDLYMDVKEQQKSRKTKEGAAINSGICF
jgi:hypothetical protein